MSKTTRRALFGNLFGRGPDPEDLPAPAPAPAPSPVPTPLPSRGPPPGSPSGPPAVPMRPARPGIFAIQQNLCLAWKNVSCSTCRERCPVPGVITVEAGRPTIAADACTGCGECVRVCPAPILAIRFVPAPAAPKGT